MQTPPTPAADHGCPERARDALQDAVREQEHVMTTHLAVIEGWLGLLEDDTLDEEQCRRAACVVRERTEALRLDMGVLLRLVKESTTPENRRTTAFSH